MTRIGELIFANLNLRVFLPLLAVALATTWYGLFHSTAEFAAMTGGLSFMDMQPWLTVDRLFAQIATYSEDTVRYYIGWSLFDWLWPFVTFTTMLFISAWLLTLLPERWRRWFWLFVGSAYTTVLLDWGENTGFVALVLMQPAEPRWLAQLTLVLHAGKLFFNMVFNLLTWILLAVVLVTQARRRLRRANPGG